MTLDQIRNRSDTHLYRYSGLICKPLMKSIHQSGILHGCVGVCRCRRALIGHIIIVAQDRWATSDSAGLLRSVQVILYRTQKDTLLLLLHPRTHRPVPHQSTCDPIPVKPIPGGAGSLPLMIRRPPPSASVWLG